MHEIEIHKYSKKQNQLIQKLRHKMKPKLRNQTRFNLIPPVPPKEMKHLPLKLHIESEKR